MTDRSFGESGRGSGDGGRDHPGPLTTEELDTARPAGDTGLEGHSETGRARGASGPAARRRQFLKAWAAPVAATAVAGCAAFDRDDDPLVADLEPGDTTSFGGAMRFGDAYAMTVSDASGEPNMRGRFDGPDRYLRYQEDGTTVESYLVDGDGYIVADGDCTSYPDLDAGGRAVESVTPPDDADDPAQVQLSVTGRTEIDGRSMFVLEPTDETTSDEGRPGATYYVDESSRYPRRIETAASVVDYRDWGAVEPVEPPAVDCRPQDAG